MKREFLSPACHAVRRGCRSTVIEALLQNTGHPLTLGGAEGRVGAPKERRRES